MVLLLFLIPSDMKLFFNKFFVKSVFFFFSSSSMFHLYIKNIYIDMVALFMHVPLPGLF